MIIALTFFAQFTPGVTWASTNHSGTISADETWSYAGSPHIITGNVIVQGSGSGLATLTIEPGCEVKFNIGTYLQIGSSSGGQGALYAVGNSGSPITFTSNASIPAPGDWGSIRFHDTTDDAGTTLDYCTIRYGGRSNTYNIYCSNSSPAIQHCTISNSANYGIYTAGGNPSISNSTISNNNQGVYVGSGKPSITNGNMTGNTLYGVYCAGGTVDTVTNCSITGNGTALRVMPYTNLAGSTVSGNTNNIIELNSGTIQTDFTWRNMNASYVFFGNVIVQGSGSGLATLTIEPGCEVKFNPGTYLQIGSSSGGQGALYAAGNSGSPITFTSNESSPAPGDWNGIRFLDTTDDTGTTLAYCTIRYGGRGSTYNIYCSNSSPAIQHCTISNSLNYGIYTAGGSPSIVCSAISYNNVGVYVAGGNPSISDCNITGNTVYGVQKSATPTLTVENNWWGHASGPGTVGPGSGDKVSNYVDYTPWLGSPATCVATAIELVSFTADAEDDGTVTLTWETATEVDNAGFNIYRSRRENGTYTGLNNAPIPSQGNEVAGASYSFEDKPGRGTFYYKLEDVDTSGISTMHGPEKVRVKK